LSPRHRLLDLTRLVSRVGRGPLTGIDRVELAYLDRFLADMAPASFLIATRRHALLLGKPAARAFRERLFGGTPWGPPDLWAMLSPRLPAPRRRAEAFLRRMADARSRPGRIAGHLPEGTDYYNVGHSNLGAAHLADLGRVPGGRRTVLIHDTIPLDHPEFSRPEASAGFTRKLAAVSAGADRVVYISQDTATRAGRHLAACGREPPHAIAPIGVSLAAPEPAALPPGMPPDVPYFVTIGTIEPRKNHALLLDIWADFHATRAEADIPRLLILGSRGWRNEDAFHRLDTAPCMGRTVFELAGLCDGAVAALLQGATALLFPSLAEGFGLPPLEALARGVPAVVAPLPVYRETLGDLAVYAAPDDRYLWADTIKGLAENRVSGTKPGQNRPTVAPPSWEAHFKTVLTRS
jgi:glycosyltransferase involved in cell wall biosynthesis